MPDTITSKDVDDLLSELEKHIKTIDSWLAWKKMEKEKRKNLTEAVNLMEKSVFILKRNHNL